VSDLRAELAARSATRDDGVHRPLRFHAANEADRRHMLALLAVHRGAMVFDRIADQLAELMETRNVGGKLTVDERNAAAEQHLAGRPPEHHGAWFWYPWSRRLVHVLPQDEFDELRLSRNRNKITAAEQRRLRELDVLVVGLSVGRATAVTLALEGVCGRLRLADFDVLELSNLNRIRDSIFGLGLGKAVLAGREIAEIDPYLDVEIYPQGVSAESLDAVLTLPRPVDIVVEECDDLEMKLRIRERARALAIPVVMETSDRGMLDVERFDLEPTRPIFHGLVGDLQAAELRGLDTYRKVPHVLRIIGADTMSQRMAASLVDVETSLKTWPQLASAVALGGALNTEAVRRIGLGELRVSGRYYTDLDRTLAVPADLEPPRQQVEVATARLLELPPMPSGTDDWRTWARYLVAHATLAPSGGNTQPWRFAASPTEVLCMIDSRSPTLLDFDARASALACGATAASLCVAAAAAGRPWSVSWSDPCDSVAWRAAPDGTTTTPDPVRLDALVRRCSNRELGTRRALGPDEIAALVGSTRDAEVTVLADDAAMTEIGEILATADRLRMLNQRLHRELIGELRWTRHEALATGDGIDLDTLALDATQRAAIALSRSWPLMATLEATGGGDGLGRGSRRAAASAAGFALVRARGSGRAAFCRGGFALLHVWLAAEAMGLGVQPTTALLYLIDRVAGGGEGLSGNEMDTLRALDGRLRTAFGASPGVDLMLVRLTRAPAPTARSVRRPLDIVLEFHDH
jgi:molybdopterin/thiamine biosynthesis adenylyltransferase